MEVEFDDKKLLRVFTDAQATAGHGNAVDRGFRKVVGVILAASDERDLRALRGLGYERLKGNRSHEWAVRINDQWRLIFQFRGQAPQKKIVLMGIEDYH